MKKHLSLLFVLAASACTGPAANTSSASLISSNQESVVVSSSDLVSSSEKSSSSSNQPSSSSVINSSSASSSTPISSSSSISSSKEEEKFSSLEAYNVFHEGLRLKNSTYVAENYIEEKLINGKILTNKYFGTYATRQYDDGYVVYLDQGLYHYSKVGDDILIDECKSINKETRIFDYFYTTYDLLSYRNRWKTTSEDFVFTSTNDELAEIICLLADKPFSASMADSFVNTLTVAEDGSSAAYQTEAFYDGESIIASFLVKDLGTTRDEEVENFLADAAPLETTNDFPNETKEIIKAWTGFDLPAPEGASYAHSVEYYYSQGQIVQITYEDFLVGNKIDEYRQTLEDNGFSLSDNTNETGDLKQYDYVRYYYEITVNGWDYMVETYYIPKINLDSSKQGFFPKGIFHISLY